ncbi:uncharacterized protein LOC100141857 isoform X1 [Tribolium castaneum]|uniref:uncharacterized protein LOC100141857 isoform X1 n=1 Tax=Tribolium castaneum TaxID=7070 RepID=UPI00017583B9|nr:PREDICTED: uncharacterized protein LOC100141857 [Tribolium castaneum]|eukprot:XP_001812133.1 PREDICTED: uncharacterized protein LOC100141857 [Tribolium castaneum]
MSRRARLEEEKQRHLNSELEEEENRLKAQRERIYAPIIWKRLGSGIRIQDLKPVYYDQVLRIIQECYFQEEVLCRNSNLGEDPDSIKSFLNMVLFYLKDRTSIIALDESNEDAVAGFLVLKAVHKTDFSNVFGRVFHVEGEAHKKCLAFTNYLGRKADVYTDLNCDIFLQFCLLCIRPEYRKKALGLQLFLSAVDVARSLNIPVVMGILSCWTLQKLAKRIGMKTVFEIDYVGWRDRFNEMIFDDPGIGNYTCAVMAGPVPPPPEVEPPPKVDEVEEKLTREEKRKAKEKKKRKQGTK